ncbi:MAG: biotin--[acetyl-CoA-carboxylase] ligase [Acidimicrobiales bacterium]
MTNPAPGRRTFTHLRWFDELGSTNTWLLESAGWGAPEGTVVVADRQSAGRGRLGRTWESGESTGLLTSILFRPHVPADELFCVSALVALAARDAIGSVAGVSVGVKWPNDLVSDDQKLAGLLAEARGVGTAEVAVVVGIGINLSWPMPGEADDLRATCLQAVAGRPIERERLLESMLDSLEGRRPRLDDPAGRQGLVAELAACTATVGRRVRVELANESFSGVAVALDPKGRLEVDAVGGRRAISAGDVVHLR